MECYTDLLPVITKITNISLETATVPNNLKCAALDPRLKKDSLSTDEFSSFRPISNLKFVSKCIEKVVATQLDQHITSNNLDEPMQSAFKKHHSTETALIKVQNDILQAIDNQNSVILLLLDISAAFDTIDHEILLSRLSSRYGITGKAHKWFESYLNERTFTVHVSGGQSTKRTLRSGVPQGSILNALLHGLSNTALERIQKVQNAAARIVTLTRKRDHITPVLFNLHWLPIKERIQYKILLITFKALSGQAPGYISDLLEVYVPRRNLRSSSDRKLVVPNYNLETYGRRSFRVSAPILWNNLPQNVRLCESIGSFKSELKTHLFRIVYKDFI